MNLTTYPYDTFSEINTFEFTSKGQSGEIRKVVCFQSTEIVDVYNLAFGDRSDNQIDDLSVSNNGDREIILATVAHLIVIFTDKFPSAWIYAKGSTPARTRLYQMGINKHIIEIEIEFEIYGQFNDQWEIFSEHKNYQGFLVRRKKN